MDFFFGSLIRPEHEEPKYPMFVQSVNDENKVERVQIMVSPWRFAMVIAHPISGHLSCYALCKPGVWADIQNIVHAEWFMKYRKLYVSYEGYGSDMITWMASREGGKLHRPVQTGLMPVDFWVGFAIPHSKGGNIHDAMRIAMEFESLINRTAEEHDPSNTGQAGNQ